MQQDSVDIKKINQRKANGLGALFIIIIIVHVLVSTLINLLDTKGIGIPSWLLLIVSELTILIPAAIYIVANRMSFGEDLGFKKIKAGTVLMSLIIGLLAMPVASFVNIVSQLFVSNTMVQASDQLLGGSLTVMTFLGGFYGPFVEEFVFRAVFYRTYDKIKGGIAAVLVSALLFGLMHLNVNQACYAFVLGIIFAVLNKASGSVYTSMIVHTVVNTWNLLLLGGVEKMYSSTGVDFAEAAESVRTSNMIYISMAVYLILAIGAILIMIPCYGYIGRHEGNLEELKSLFVRDAEEKFRQKREGAALLANIPTIIAVLLCLAVMFGINILFEALGIG